MEHKNWFALFTTLAILLGNLQPVAAPIAHAVPKSHTSAPIIPVADLVNPDGTLNTQAGKAGTVDLRGWNARLDLQQGLVLSPQAPAAAGVSGLGNGLSGFVYAIAASGSDLYVGGFFTQVCGNATCNSGNLPMNNIARWDGSSWSPLGSGLDGTVSAIAVSGSDVYVGGDFTQVCGNLACSSGTLTVNGIARWDGSNWSALGNGLSSSVFALAVSGSDLYVGGLFRDVCGNPACDSGNLRVYKIARWNGSSWSGVGYGVIYDSIDALAFVSDLAMSGSDLYVGGSFKQVCGNTSCNSGNLAVNNIARWNGSSWSSVGDGVNSPVDAIAVSGSDVYLGGRFTQVCGDPACNSGILTVNLIARWNGSSWSALGNGVGVGEGVGDTVITSLAVSGNDVYVGGNFTQICGNEACDSGNLFVSHFAQWNGGSWSALGRGLEGPDPALFVFALALNGSDVYLGGTFTQAAGKTVNRILTFKSWSGSGLGNGVNGSVLALAVSGGDVYAGGAFTHVCGDPTCTSGNVQVNHLARWNGRSWSALGAGVDNAVYALAVSGGDVYAGGYLTQACGNLDCNSGNVTVNHIARWNGSSWSAVGGGLNGLISALAVSGSDVYAGGGFTQVCGNPACNSGNVTVNRIARWNGSSWAVLGAGLNSAVLALAVSGSDVIAGGDFTQVCGDPTCTSGNGNVNRVARWNGSIWSGLGNGVDGEVRALAVSGSDVYAGGVFTNVCGNLSCTSGNVLVNHIAHWNGTAWSGLGYGVNQQVNALVVNWGEVYVAGIFTQVCGDPSCFASNLTANRLARWNTAGNLVSALGDGVDNYVFALAESGGDLFAGGLFIHACGNASCSIGNLTVNHIVKWIPAEELWRFYLVYLPMILQ
jgi:trimeric autotransporter adhesin